MGDVVVPREAPLSWRPSRELRARLVAEAARRGVPLGRLVEELCLAGLAGPSFLIAPDAVTVSDERGEFVSVGDVLPDSPKLPPQLKEAKPRVPPKVPESLQQAVVAAAAKGGSVVKASQVCARERFHRPGVYCKECGKGF